GGGGGGGGGGGRAGRIATDRRSLLVEWRARVRREPKTHAGPGKLDALLGVGHVLSGVRATAGAEPTGTGVELPARRRFHRLKIAAALLPAAVGIGALALWPRAEVAATVPAAPAPRAVAAPPAAAAEIAAV